MPFGLANAPATFLRLMEMVLRGINWERCLVYLDDTLKQAGQKKEDIFFLPRNIFIMFKHCIKTVKRSSL